MAFLITGCNVCRREAGAGAGELGCNVCRREAGAGAGESGIHLEIKFKVIAYILRFKNNQKEILVFDHLDFPEAGVQVPGGTIEKNELPTESLIREIKEETGLVFFETDMKFIGESEYQRKDKPEINLRKYYQINSSNLKDFWVHTVESNGEDQGLKFYFYWLPLEDAKKQLTGNFAELFDQI